MKNLLKNHFKSKRDVLETDWKTVALGCALAMIASLSPVALAYEDGMTTSADNYQDQTTDSWDSEGSQEGHQTEEPASNGTDTLISSSGMPTSSDGISSTHPDSGAGQAFFNIEDPIGTPGNVGSDKMTNRVCEATANGGSKCTETWENFDLKTVRTVTTSHAYSTSDDGLSGTARTYHFERSSIVRNRDSNEFLSGDIVKFTATVRYLSGSGWQVIRVNVLRINLPDKHHYTSDSAQISIGYYQRQVTEYAGNYDVAMDTGQGTIVTGDDTEPYKVTRLAILEFDDDPLGGKRLVKVTDNETIYEYQDGENYNEFWTKTWSLASDLGSWIQMAFSAIPYIHPDWEERLLYGEWN